MKNTEPEICEVPRWQMIKASLENLNYDDFLRSASEDESAVMIDVRTEEEALGFV